MTHLATIRLLLKVTLIGTVAALVVMLVFLTLVMIAIPGGIVVVAILFSAPNAGLSDLAALLLWGLTLIGPISAVLLPALAFLMHGRHRSWRWLLLPTGFIAGQWWGHLIAPHLHADPEAPAGPFSLLAGIGGLVAAMVFARWLRRSSVNSSV